MQTAYLSATNDNNASISWNMRLFTKAIDFIKSQNDRALRIIQWFLQLICWIEWLTETNYDNN